MKTSMLTILVMAMAGVMTANAQLRGLEAVNECDKSSLKINQALPVSSQVLTLLQKSERSAGQCAVRISGVQSKIDSVHKIAKRAADIADKLDRHSDTITKTLDRVDKNVNSVTKIAKRVPKLGKLIQLGARIFSSITRAMKKVTTQADTLNTALEKLEAALGKASETVEAVQSKYETAETKFGQAATVHDGAMECVYATTQSCKDDDALEKVSQNIQGVLQLSYQGVSACDKVYDQVEKGLDQVLEAFSKLHYDVVEKALDALEDKLAPVLEDFDKIVKSVRDKVNEGYCCATPFPLQQLGELASQVIDVATCPLDGLLAGVEQALGNVVLAVGAELHDTFLDAIEPVVRQLQRLHDNAMLEIPTIEEFTAGDACTLQPPSISLETYPLFDERLLDSIPLRMERPEVVHFNLGRSIVDACKESASSLGKVSRESCCVEFRGIIKNGDFCDPSGTVPYKHCSMCDGGKNEFWWQKGHQACGSEPCMPDGTLCGVGTTCNSCCRRHSYWYSKALTACGKEPCWKKGTKCGAGTTCKQCCNGSKYKFPNLWHNCK